MSTVRLALGVFVLAPLWAAHAAGWPKVFDGMECVDAGGGVEVCDPERYTAFADASATRGSDAAPGTWSKSGADVRAIFFVDTNGDGIPDTPETYDGVFDAATGCASGTFIDASGRSGNWQACRA